VVQRDKANSSSIAQYSYLVAIFHHPEIYFFTGIHVPVERNTDFF
jgi:hypothetical protein